MVILPHLHGWSFMHIHVLSVPPLTYKRRPGQHLPPHTSSQAFFFSFPHPSVHRNSICSVCLFCPATWPTVLCPVPDEVDTEILQTFSSRCTPMSPTTYPKIATSGAMKQPRSDLPCSLLYLLFTSTNRDSNSFLILVDSDVPLMHQSLHIVFSDVISVCAGVFTEVGHDSTRNVISV
jgi:hypothetical protein